MLIDVTKTWMKVEEGHFPMGLFLSLRADSVLPRLSVRLSELFRPILFLVKWTSTRSGLRRIESPDWFAYDCWLMFVHACSFSEHPLIKVEMISCKLHLNSAKLYQFYANFFCFWNNYFLIQHRSEKIIWIWNFLIFIMIVSTAYECICVIIVNPCSINQRDESNPFSGWSESNL